MSYVRKLTVIFLAVVLTVTFSFPAWSWAETETGLISGEKAVEKQKALNEQAEKKAALQQKLDTLEAEPVPVDLEEAAEEASVSASYQKQFVADLYEAGTFHCSSDALTITEDADNGGLMIEGAPEDINNAVFTFDDDLVLDGDYAARVSLDALAPVRTAVKADIYLDEAESPIVSFTMVKQKTSKKWDRDGDRTIDIGDKGLKGTHSMSMKIITESTEKKTQVLLRSIEFAENDKLPTVYLDIDETVETISSMNTDPAHETECVGDMTLVIPAGYQSEYGGTETETLTRQTYAMEYIRGRGNSTWFCDKKPYKIKLDSKADLLNMGKNKHWVLLANRYDNSQLRNKITYWMGEEMGMLYTPKCEFVDVVMNGEYLGGYYLCEQIRVDKNRVEIDDLEKEGETGTEAVTEPTITGGYLLGTEPYAEDVDDHPEQMFTTDNNFSMEIESPEFTAHTEKARQAQYDYIKEYFQKTENAIYGEGCKDKNGVSWDKYLDADAAMKYYWFQEVSMNGDAYVSPSTHLYKPREGKLFWGPLWDFDYVAWGSTEYNGLVTEDFMLKESMWFKKLLENEEFVKGLQEVYTEQMSPTLKSAYQENGQLDKYADKLRVSNFYDREKWGAYQFDADEGGYGDYEEYVEPGNNDLTFDEEVTRLKTWMEMRDAWITDNLDRVKAPVYKITFKSSGKVVKELELAEDEMLGELPSPGTRKGYVFGGWYAGSFDADNKVSEDDFFSCDTQINARWVREDKAVPVRSLHFALDEYTILIYHVDEDNECNYLSCTAVPFDATDQSLTWSSSDQSILKVNSTGGMVALKEGQVVVTARSANGKKASCVVNVRMAGEEVTEPDFAVTPEKMTINIGDYRKLNVKVLSGCAEPTLLSFETNSGDAAEIDECGVIHGVHEGTCVLQLTYDEGTSYPCTVKVQIKEKKGTAVTRGGMKYKITRAWKKKGKKITAGTVSLQGFASGSTSALKVPEKIKINGHTYKVTAVASKAFQKKALTSVVFGKNIRTIGTRAFYKCSKLKTVDFTGKKISKIGKQAFTGIARKAVITVPKAGKKSYKKQLKKKAGITKSMKLRTKKVSYKKL